MFDTRKMLAAYEREQGIFFPEAREFLNPEWADNFQMAMDAQPELVTTPSSGIPAFLTAIIDPNILRIRQANNNAAMIFDEVKKGTWVTESAIFPVVERGGNVTSYGDMENGGQTTANANFETRQPYLFQTVCIWGELQLARAAEAKIAWAAELQGAAADVLGKFENLIYFKGVAGLQNYGIQTDPNLLPAFAPAPKANGGFQWLSNGITPNATPNEIFVDIQTGVNSLINQSAGNIDTKSEIVIALSPSREGAITATNSFDVNVMNLLNKNYPNLRIVNAIQYGAITAQNPQGVATGEMIQFIALRPGAQDTGWLGFNEKLRAHRVVAEMSSFKQKMTSGAYGTILRQPFAIATMVGI
jgi:hypothetical protein